MKTRLILAAAVAAATLSWAATAVAATPIELLGDALFDDVALSTPAGQACAACHADAVGYTGPTSSINQAGAVYPGAVPARFGNRKPPSAAYGGDSPVLYYDEADEVWVGGMFWDGRATGWTLGDPLAEQAMGPFLNPLEQNNPSKRLVVFMAAQSKYAPLYTAVWGEPLDFKKNVDLSYERIARSIAAYERSELVNPFSSDFDAFYDTAKQAGMDVKAIDVTNWSDYTGLGLSDEAVEGLALFNDEGKGKCSLCHTLDEGSAGYPLLTDFTYDNLGVPKNPVNPFYTMPKKWNPDGKAWIDPGLGGFLKSAGFGQDVWMAEMGKHKVPSLRNVDKRPAAGFVKAYGHNGFFKSLEEITHFYNTRDVEMWPAAEYAETVNTDELGDLGLTADEEAKIVAFMRTLTDE